MPNDLDFIGKTVLITGAASGIGAACAAWLAGHRAERLVLVDRDEVGLAALNLPSQLARFAGEVADPALWERMEAEEGPPAYRIRRQVRFRWSEVDRWLERQRVSA